MTDARLITLERCRSAAPIEVPEPARTALPCSGRRLQPTPRDGCAIAHVIDEAITETCTPNAKERS